MKKYLSDREQKISVICIVVIVAVAFSNGLILPLQKKINSLREEVIAGKKQLAGFYDVIHRADNLETKYNDQLRRFGRSGTEEEIASLILTDIEKVSDMLNLHIEELKPQKISRSGSGNRFFVKLKVNSELVDVIHLIHIFQQAPYHFDVENVEFKQTVGRGRKAVTTHLVLGKLLILQEQFDDPGQENPNTESINLKLAEASEKSFRDYRNNIKIRNLFAPQLISPRSDNKNLAKAMPALHKRIKLIGILIDSDSKAIVEDLKEKQIHFLSKGERLGTALLNDIQESKVVFEYDNKKVEMAP